MEAGIRLKNSLTFENEGCILRLTLAWTLSFCKHSHLSKISQVDSSMRVSWSEPVAFLFGGVRCL